MGKKKIKKTSKPNKRNQSDSSSPNQKKNKTQRKGNKNGRRQTFDDLSTELSQHGLRVKIVASDGSCFFRSLADQLEGDNGDHLHYRTKVVDYIEQNEDNFKPFIEDDESWGDYITRMRRDGTWAGNIELQAASMALHVNFRIYQPGQPVWTIKNWPTDTHIGEEASSSQRNDTSNDEERGGSSSSRKGNKKIKPSLVEPAKTLHMAYHDGCHYNSVRAADDHGSGPPLPINAVLFDMHKEEDEGEGEEGGDNDDDGIVSDKKENSEEEEEGEPSSPDRNNGKNKNKSSSSSSSSNSEASTQPPPPPPPPAPSTSKSSKAPGRNRPCPCGSKMKYKNCCGASKRVGAAVANNSHDDGGGDDDDGKNVDGVTVRLKELLI